MFVGTIPNINDRTTSNGADIARPGDGMDWVTTSFGARSKPGRVRPEASTTQAGSADLDLHMAWPTQPPLALPSGPVV